MSEARNSSMLPVAVLLGLGTAWNGGNMGAIVSPLSADLGVSLAAIGLLSGTVFFAAAIGGTVLAQPLGERVGVERGMRVACVLLGLGNLLCALSPDFALLAAGRVIAGTGMAVGAVLGPVYCRTAGGLRAVGAFGGAFQLGIAGALAVGSVLEDAGVDWRVAFVVSAVVGSAALPFIHRHRRAGVAAGRSAHAGLRFLRVAFRSVEVAQLTLGFVAALGVPMVIGAWLVHYLTDEGDIRIAVAGALSFLLFGISAAMRLGGAALSARGVPPTVLAGLAPLIAAAGLVTAGLSDSIPVVTAAVVAMGAGFALPYAVIMVDAQRLFPADPVAPVTFVMVWTSIFLIVAVPLVGVALDDGRGELAFLALAAVVAAAGLANLRPADRPLDDGP